MREFHKTLIVPFVLSCLVLVAYGSPEAKQPAVVQDTETAVNSVNTLALDLYQRLKQGSENLFFSPYSISAALAMTYAGARGETAAQMTKTLHFDQEPGRLHPSFRALNRELQGLNIKGKIELNVANALWGEQSYNFKKSFLILVNSNYGSGLQKVDFMRSPDLATTRINNWIQDRTRDKIKDLIPPGEIDSLTRLVLTNAIYFKGEWLEKFDKRATSDAPFTLVGGRKKQVPMMSTMSAFEYMEGDGFQVLEMPYLGNELSMTIILPEMHDIEQFERSVTLGMLHSWVTRLRGQNVRVFLPKFKMTSPLFRLGSHLQSMGMTDAFSGTKADFSGMTGGRGLFIGSVLHKAFVEVAEEGTEAAAATAVIMRQQGFQTSPPKSRVFRADHPFIFFIRHIPSGCILFMGRVTDP